MNFGFRHFSKPGFRHFSKPGFRHFSKPGFRHVSLVPFVMNFGFRHFSKPGFRHFSKPRFRHFSKYGFRHFSKPVFRHFAESLFFEIFRCFHWLLVRLKMLSRFLLLPGFRAGFFAYCSWALNTIFLRFEEIFFRKPFKIFLSISNVMIVSVTSSGPANIRMEVEPPPPPTWQAKTWLEWRGWDWRTNDPCGERQNRCSSPLPLRSV